MHAFTDWNRPDFGALCLVGAYLDASVEEAARIVSALGLGPAAGAPLGLRRHHWKVLSVARALRSAFDVPWAELAALWEDLPPVAWCLPDRAGRAPPVEGSAFDAASDDDLLATLATWLHADPLELRALIRGHCRMLGLDLVALPLAPTAPTLRAVRRLWWLKTRLGVTVDEFLALESCLQSASRGADLFARERPEQLLRAARLVHWSRRLDLPLRDLLAGVEGAPVVDASLDE